MAGDDDGMFDDSARTGVLRKRLAHA
jgi:hypothetical protein